MSYSTNNHLLQENRTLRAEVIRLKAALGEKEHELGSCETDTLEVMDRQQALEIEREQERSVDPLTQLPTMLLLNDRINHAMLRARSMKKQGAQDIRPFALIVLELTNLDEVHQVVGQDVLDHLLFSLSGYLVHLVNETDTVAHTANNEFSILVEQVDSRTDLVELCGTLLKQLQQPMQAQRLSVAFAIRAGVSTFPGDGEDARQLHEYARLAMRETVSGTDESFLFYSRELNERAAQQIQLMQELARAESSGEFFLLYQPRVDAASEQLQGMEALIRWQHPVRGLQSPGEFIQTLEQNSILMRRVGLWTILTAVQQIREWLNQGAKPGFLVSVNLTVDQLRDPELPIQIQAILERVGVDSHYLELEITETQQLDNLEQDIAHVRRLQELGLRIAIDDFGTGYSSLSYLQKMGADTLKIDKCFIDSIGLEAVDDSDEGLAASHFLVKSILAIGEQMGMTVVAEGVEEQNQLQWLKRNGCDEIQGFYFSKPVSVDEIAERWLLSI